MAGELISSEGIPMTESDRESARRLADMADQVGRVSGPQPWREFLRWMSRGRLGRPSGWPVIPQLPTPWQDTISEERIGWRQRAANLAEVDEFVFAVDYMICRRCRLGWVEQPYTPPPYRRCGLAKAGLAALRAEQPDLRWHTLGGHFNDSCQFWARVGAGVPGGYEQRNVCPHVTPGG